MEVKSLYIHYPHCLHLCNYCDFYKKVFDSNSNKNFFKYLIDSLTPLESLLRSKSFALGDLETIYIGGGTPSLWGEDVIRFVDFFHDYFKINFSPREFTMEVDPGTFKEESIRSLVDFGVNRFSLGIQSFDKDIFPILDRSHEFEEIEKTLSFFSKLGVNFSVDFMIGLPEKGKKRDIESELRKINDFGPKHISLYILTVGESYPHSEFIPNDEIVSQEYLKVFEVMSEIGFNQYEVSNYAKSGFESIHNWKYWKQDSYIALGTSATGLLVNDKGLRFKWRPDGTFLEENLTHSQLELERLYTMSRTREGIDCSEFSKQALNELSNWRARNLGRFKGDRFIFNEHGFVILDSLISKII